MTYRLQKITLHPLKNNLNATVLRLRPKQEMFHLNSAAKPNIVLSIQIFDLSLASDSSFLTSVLTIGVQVDC